MKYIKSAIAIFSIFLGCKEGLIEYDYIANIEALYQFERAEAMFQMGDYKSAAVHLRQLIDYYPNIYISDDAVLLLGDCYFAQEDIPYAKRIYKHYIKKYKKRADLPLGYLRLGKCYIEEGNFKRLYKAFSKLAKIGPKSNELKEAQSIVDELLKIYPESKMLQKTRLRLERVAQRAEKR